MLSRSFSLATRLVLNAKNYIEQSSSIDAVLTTIAATLWIQQRYLEADQKKEPSLTLAAKDVVVATLVARKVHQAYQNWDTKQIIKSVSGKLVSLAENLPYIGPKVRAEIDKEVKKTLLTFKSETDAKRSEWKPIHTLPEEGLDEEVIRKRFEKLHAHYLPGKLSGGVYTQYEPKLLNLLKDIWAETALTNPMHSEWPLINLMEAEVISMCQNLFRGKEGAPGIITHGGTSSNFEACYAYISYARNVFGVQKPEIIIPDTAHVSFDKAAERYFAKLIKVPVNKDTGAADVRAMEKYINHRTCMIVGSAPSFPKGIIDPIRELGAIALKHKIPLHVDSCLGGFVTAFAKETEFKIPDCDFSIPGVTSISADMHKYGQAPKGTSVLLFKENCKASPAHVHLGWTGGMYVTPSTDGSRSGADIALVWAVLCSKGKRRYVDDTIKILQLSRDLMERISKIKGLEVIHRPQLSVIAIRSISTLNMLLIASQFKKMGWSINILQTRNQQPDGFHFSVTTVHANLKGFADQFIDDLTRAVEYAEKNPNEKPSGMAGVYGSLTYVPSFIESKVGRGYINILNTLPDVKDEKADTLQRKI